MSRYPERILNTPVFVAHSKALEDFHADPSKFSSEMVALENHGMFKRDEPKMVETKAYQETHEYYVIYPEEKMFMKKAIGPGKVSPAVLESGNLDDLLNLKPHHIDSLYLDGFLPDFDFLEGNYAGRSGWEYEGLDEGNHQFTTKVFLEVPDQEDTEPCSLHIVLDEHFNLVDMYNYLIRNGEEYGVWKNADKDAGNQPKL